jgi:hypothetical protein
MCSCTTVLLLFSLPDSPDGMRILRPGLHQAARLSASTRPSQPISWFNWRCSGPPTSTAIHISPFSFDLTAGIPTLAYATSEG